MKTIAKCLISGGIIIAAGAAMLTAGLCMGGATTGEKYTAATYTATESVTSVQIEAECAVVNISYYDGEYAQIIYPESYKRTNTITLRGGVLEIKSDVKAIFSLVSVNNDGPELTVNLPNSYKVNLELELDYGEMNVADGDYSQVDISLNASAVNVGNISCTTLNIEVNAGEVVVSSAACTTMNIEVNAGKVEISYADCPMTEVEVNAGKAVAAFGGAKAEYTIRCEVNLGSSNVSSQTGTTAKYINMEVNVGSAEIYFEG